MPDPTRTSEEISKHTGDTPAEKYLASLCERTFLSLWSYPSPYKDDGPAAGRGHGREICDLLVVCDSDVIIFSDKHVEFPTSAGPDQGWARWFRRAIYSAAKQAWGAQRWIRRNTDRVYVDRACTQRLPVAIPADSRFHLVVVAHGVSAHVRRFFGDSGTLMVNMVLRGPAAHVAPFSVGDLDPRRTFVHVLDDESLVALLRSRDTVTDLLAYLDKREKLLRGSMLVAAAGEEELLALYLTRMNARHEHDFALVPEGQEPPDSFHIDKGFWDSFESSPERARQQEADRVSYVWDRLIDSFGSHALKGTQYVAPPGGISETERVLRLMARETRLARRGFGALLVDMLKTTPTTHRRIRVGVPYVTGGAHYVFVLLPRPRDVSYEEYRRVRADYLGSCCLVARHVYPTATDIVGITTEPGIDNELRSEDLAYFDGRLWTPEHEAEAISLQQDLGILTQVTTIQSHLAEYPD